MSTKQTQPKLTSERIEQFGEEDIVKSLQDRTESNINEKLFKNHTKVTMNLDPETVLDVGFIKGYLELPTEADAVKVAANVFSLLLNETKRGNSIIIQSKSGSQTRLNIEKRSRS